MRRRLLVVALLSSVSLVTPLDWAGAQPAAASALTYPLTKRVDLVETQFGVKVADPYRWLENDVRTDAGVKAWVDQQNAVTNAFLNTLPGRQELKDRLTQLFDYERFAVPEKKGGRYFYTHNSGLQNQSVLFVRDSANGEGRVLIDPNPWSKDGATALAEWQPNEQGTKLLYAIQDGGTDWRTLKVRDVKTSKDMPDTVKWVKFSGLSWAKDGSGFYYSRFPEPKSSGTYQSLNENQRVYFHKLGTKPSADRMLFATPKRPELNHGAQVSDDGRWLVITSSSGTDDRYEVTLIDLKQAKPKPRVLIPGFEHNWSYVGNRGSTFYFITDEGAPRQKIVSLDIASAKPIHARFSGPSSVGTTRLARTRIVPADATMACAWIGLWRHQRRTARARNGPPTVRPKRRPSAGLNRAGILVSNFPSPPIVAARPSTTRTRRARGSRCGYA